jgi:hypothetical protein
LAAGPSRDAALGSYIDALAESNPELAVGWIDRLIDPETRSSRIESVATVWLAADPPAAQAWLKTVELTEDQKQRLLKE